MTTTAESSLWEVVQTDFKTTFPQDVYRTWFESIKCTEVQDDAITLEVPSEFAAIWIQDNYLDLIQKRLQMAAGHNITVHLTVRSQKTDNTQGAPRAGEMPQASTEPPQSSAPNRIESSFPKAKNSKSSQYVLNPKYTFENFVVGLGNQLAHAACIAVANAPGRAYNPLFLYGDTGLGKTHLMQAIAYHALSTNPDTKIVYISTEKFTNEFIRAIQENSLVKFRQRYRNADILLIDDIHFLSGKERIQEEFFHTFNELFESSKQIVLSSDRPASEIAKLESRLISRFQWGLVTDIQAPDFETRVAILRKKANTMQLDLMDEVLEFLAERVSRNVRRMEGALTRVAGYAALTHGCVDIPSIEKLLQDILQEEAQNQISVDKIQEKVSEHYKIPVSAMLSKRRPANIAFPRQIAMYLSRMLTSHSLQEIGDSFGGRDHGTVIHACKTVENMMDQDSSVKTTIDYLQHQLANHR